MAEPLVLFDLDENGIAKLTLNRADKLNAFTMEMLAEWHAHLVRCMDDPAVRFVILTGSGRAFCAGGDTGAMKKRSGNDSLEQKNFLWRHVHPIAMALERLDKPMVAAINGLARGAGLDMALMCDMRFMAASATVSEAYINMGLTAGDGGTWFLPRLIGLDRALDLMWTGRVVDSAEALRIGLVTEVVEDAELMNAVYAFARRVAAQPMEAVRMCKRATYQGREMGLVPHLDMLSSHMSVLRDTPEHRERVAAFVASRAAKAKHG